MKPISLTQTVLCLAMAIFTTGCATIVSRTSYPVAIRTNPKGAFISITDKKGKEVYKGRSPATVTLKSGGGYFAKAEYEVKLSAPGFNEENIRLNYKLNAWYFGNVLLGGLIGMLIVDPATGAMWKLDSPPIDATLTKSTAGAETPTLKILNVRDVPENIRTSLVKIN